MRLVQLISAVLAAFVLAAPASAHFAWLATDADGHAVLYFGESPAETDYHMPEAVEKAQVVAIDADGAATEVELIAVDSEEFIGRRSPAAAPEAAGLETQIVYGVYHGTKLVYYVQHDLTLDATPSVRKESPLAMRAEITTADEGAVQVKVLWKGEPLAGADVKLYCEEGHEEGAETTNDEGVVVFSGSEVESGVNGIIVGHTVKDDAGEIDGTKYTSASHYLTATFRVASEEEEPEVEQTSDLPRLPEAIASFGAVVSDGWLYVYSGHTGTAHDHSRENLSKHFCRLPLEGGQAWESLPCDAPLQGLPLVAHGGYVYRVGGLDARNEPDADEDLHSTDAFARFDPQAKAWESLPALPNGRSSHDAVVIGDKLYVAGGWTLSGSSKGEWLDHGLVIDLTAPEKGWKEFETPFRRRALATAHLDDQLLVIGGMDEDQDISGRIDAFDPAKGEWSEVAELPGGGWTAFGVSAWNHDGALYASGMEGVLYRLSSVDGEWEQVGELREKRFFHRLLPTDGRGLFAIGGASPDHGHLDSAELIVID